jgi:glycosyltransferase involved in cell wall biosynthesis
MKIAVVHDYFTQLGGAEKVAEHLFAMMPQADLFTTVALENRLPDGLKDIPINTSWMQSLPMMHKLYRLYFLLYPFAVNSLDLTGYDLIVSSSSGYAKGICTPRDAVHVCYCHTPMRWAWNFDGYSKRETMNAAMRSSLKVLVSMLRNWDRDASRKPDHFVANSRTVAERIEKVYGRFPEIIHPPIDVHRFRPVSRPDASYYLVISRLISYKRLDLAVQACTRMNRNLIVVGAGPHREALESIAGPTVKFAGRVDDDEVLRLAANCKALLFPGEEDFGMAPLEVAAAGRPTIAFRAGGATETIKEERTGLFFDEQTPESLMAAIDRFETLAWSSAELRRHAEEFSVNVFRERFADFLTRIGAPLSHSTPVSWLAPSQAGKEWRIGGARLA